MGAGRVVRYNCAGMTVRKSTAISPETISALVRENRLDGAAAGELLKWADERLKDLVRVAGELERKMQIMLAVDLAILYLLLRAGGLPAAALALSPPRTEAAAWAWLWSVLLLLAWGCAVLALSYLVRGLLTANEFGLRGDHPANWNVKHVTLPPDGDAEKNRDRMLAHLCAKYSGKIKITQEAYDRKLRLYKRGLLWHRFLLAILAVGALFRILAGMPL